MPSFTINGRLIGFNEYSQLQRTNAFMGAKKKREDTEKIAWLIRSTLKKYSAEKPVVVHFAWYEPNRRRDMDNVAGYGHKVILDALVKAGALKDDGWKYVKGFTDRFAVDKQKPRIIVTIEEVEDD